MKNMKKKLSFILLTVAALLVALAAGPVFGQGEDGLARADKARQANTETLMAKPGVVGVALGFNPAGRAAVKVYTEHSEVKNIPHELDGVPVHKVVIGKVSALRPDAAPAVAPSASHTKARFDRPVPIGVSTGHPDITAGTIGARVRDVNGNVYALSNNHVYANQNDAANGDPVIQPGSYDGGSSSADDIGTLADFQTIVFSTSASNVIDAAIASTNASLVGNSTPDDGYGTPQSTTVAAFPGLKVIKYGRTTVQTKGRVDSVNATLNIGYGDSGVARFVNQIVITPGRFSAGGDSGSLIVTQDGHYPVGLLYAGSPWATIANPIDAVLDRFNVTIDGAGGAPPPPPATGSITGTVSNGTGAGIGGANVRADTGQSATTADDGTYTIDDVPTGDRMVTATATDYMSDNAPATVIDGQTTPAIDFSLQDAPETPPPPSGGALAVSVSTDKDSYVKRETATITANVIDTNDGNSPVAGAAVRIEVTTAKGGLLACTPITNSAGVATCTYKVNPNRDGVGTYTVDATATKGGYTSGSGSDSFEVTN